MKLSRLFWAVLMGSSLAHASQPKLPEAPTELSFAFLGSSGLRLTWQDNADNEDGYRIERFTKDGQSGMKGWKLVGSVPANVTTFESTGMLAEDGVSYQHRVYGYNKVGAGRAVTSEEITMPPFDETPNGRIIVQSNETYPRTGEGSIIQLKNGNLVYYFAAFQGSVHDFAHGVVARVISEDGGKTWSDFEVVLEDEQARYSRVAAISMANGDIALSYGYHIASGSVRGNQHNPTDEDRATVVFRYSSDEGASWSEEQFIGDDPEYTMTHSLWDGLHLLSNGRILTMIQASRSAESRYGTFFRYSDDSGRSWTRVPEVGRLEVLHNPYENNEMGFWELGVVEYEPGKLLGHGRTVTGWLYETRSEDFGETWTKPRRLDVPHPKGPACLTAIPNSKTIAKIWNPHVDPNDKSWTNWALGRRVILASQLSDDGGKSWYGYKEIEYNSDGDWYCYPSVLWEGETMHLAYFDWPDHFGKIKRSNVRYQKLHKDWFLNP